ncbi:DUF6438 domain-containing protein [Flavobacterium sp. J372]|uniref:DUF6438 domain-containing protein n=1 Tax=Flavobacterium sp. J372 TaxID=2898436 RepID=UPI002150AA53|nr:DUF6438 domain-containing protein [Flavobacterium sp. J372]MCR5862852.1 DUF6438 domain-containing protein [Flavobacterium sp. J372]
MKKKWQGLKIKKITADTLVIGQDTLWTTFIKKRYDIDSIPDFDAIKVYFGGCYGTCPVQQIVIFKSGNVLYDGFEYVDNIGSFKSTVKRQQFSNIARRFKEAKYNVLYDDYFESVSDMRRIIVTFYQNNKIIKSVSDYASSSPDEFQWAYIKVEHLISQLKMYKDTTRVASDNFKLLPPPVKE